MADTELEMLMSMDPLELSKNEKAIQAIIDYERQARLEFELGVKMPKKDKAVSFNMDTLMQAMLPAAQAQPTFKRRI